jgi:uncharacterized RDD family membrane protein YckC
VASTPAGIAALLIDSATGVDVRLRVAGPGARTLAFLIDWSIRLVLTLSWYAVAALAYNGRFDLRAPLSPDAVWFAAVVAPSAALYFLYHYVLETAMRGRTPGKRMVGVRIVSRDGDTPSMGALLTRNVFRLIDGFPFVYSIGLITTLVTREHVRIGDLAAGTVLIYERSSVPPPSQASGGGDAATAEIAGELSQRWDGLAAQARRRLALRLLEARGSAGAPGDSDAQLRQRVEQLFGSAS